MSILAGDIGGTKTVLAIFEDSGSALRMVREQTYASRQHASLEEIVLDFVESAGHPSIRVACFGVAGPVIDGRSQTTNLPWILEESSLAAAARCARVKLLNDVEAGAIGMLHLEADELAVLQPGHGPDRPGNVAVIAAGTGLGEAMLFWDGQRHHPIASEGGHADFAPRTEEEIALLRYLRAKHASRVSYERVLSGPGFFDLYTFLRLEHGAGEPEWLTERLRAGDPSAVVTEVGLAGTDEVCVRALELFASLYGAEAGNLALKCVAMGGVFVGGGIAPKMLPVLEAGHFVAGFTDKGRFAELLRRIRVSVALGRRTPLIGAAHHARQL